MYADDVRLNLRGGKIPVLKYQISEIHQETKENTNRGSIKQNITVSASYLAHIDRLIYILTFNNLLFNTERGFYSDFGCLESSLLKEK